MTASPAELPPCIYGREAAPNERVYPEATVRALVDRLSLQAGLAAQPASLWQPIATAPRESRPEDAVPVLIAKYGFEPFVAVWTPRWGWVATVYFAESYSEFRSDLDEELARTERGFEPDVWMPLAPVPAPPRQGDADA